MHEVRSLERRTTPLDFVFFSGIRQLLKTHSADAQEHLSCDLAWLGRKCEATANAGNSAEVRLNLFEQIVMDF